MREGLELRVSASGVKLRQLREMRVVVGEIEAVHLGARKDQKVRKRNSQTCRPTSICQPNGSLPHCRRDLVVGKQSLIVAERLTLGVVRDPSPQLESH